MQLQATVLLHWNVVKN